MTSLHCKDFLYDVLKMLICFTISNPDCILNLKTLDHVYFMLFNFPEMLNDRQRHPLACPMHSSPQSVHFYNALNFMHFEEVL